MFLDAIYLCCPYISKQYQRLVRLVLQESDFLIFKIDKFDGQYIFAINCIEEIVCNYLLHDIKLLL